MRSLQFSSQFKVAGAGIFTRRRYEIKGLWGTDGGLRIWGVYETDAGVDAGVETGTDLSVSDGIPDNDSSSMSSFTFTGVRCLIKGRGPFVGVVFGVA